MKRCSLRKHKIQFFPTYIFYRGRILNETNPSQSDAKFHLNNSVLLIHRLPSNDANQFDTDQVKFLVSGRCQMLHLSRCPSIAGYSGHRKIYSTLRCSFCWHYMEDDVRTKLSTLQVTSKVRINFFVLVK